MPIAEVYADGGVVLQNPSPYGGTWAWCFVDEHGAIAAYESGFMHCLEAIPLPVTNNIMEFIAVVRALEALPEGWSGKLYSDSKVTLGRFFDGWPLRNIPTWWARRGEIQIKQRLGRIEPVLLVGHPTRLELKEGVSRRHTPLGTPVSRFNVFCDEECRRQAGELMSELHKEEVKNA
jgi:ribonuclease HI